MDDTKNGNGLGGGHASLAWMVALVTAAVGLHWYQNPLTSSRPEARPWPIVTRSDDQPIEARLWQDPMAAVEAVKDEPASNNQGRESPAEAKESAVSTQKPSNTDKIAAPKLAEMIKTRCQRFSPVGDYYNYKKVSVLVVLTNGRRYAESAEERIRHRSAVISALGVADLVPENSNGLGCVRIPWSQLNGEQCGGGASGPASTVKPSTDRKSPTTEAMKNLDDKCLEIPFEWFRRKVHTLYSGLQHRLTIGKPLAATEYPPTNVLVLWVDEELMRQNPLYRLAMLVELLRGNDQLAPRPKGGPLQS